MPRLADETAFRTASAPPSKILAGMSAAGLRAHLTVLHTITEGILAHLTLPDLFHELLSRLRTALDVDAVTVLLCDPSSNTLVVRASQGLEGEVAPEDIEVPLGEGIAGRVASRREALIVDNVATIARGRPLLKKLVSVMAAPLLAENDLLGVLQVGTQQPRRFTDAELCLLKVVSDRVALATKNALLYEHALRQASGRAPNEEAVAESNSVQRILAETAADAIITIDGDSTIVSANPAAAETFGYTLEELIGRPFTELIPERFRSAHRAGVIRYLETGEKRLPWRRMELRGLHRSGREIPLDVSFAERTHKGRRLFTGTLRDITEQKRTQRILTAQYATARVLAEAPDVERAFPEIIRGIAEALDWDAGGFWLWDPSIGALQPVASWTAPTIPLDGVEQVNEELTFPPGAGLPGRVWETKKPCWIRDLRADGNFARLAAVARLGLRSGFAFPICVSGECLGVMEFFTRETTEEDEGLLASMDALGSDIGQYIRRREAEGRLEEQEEIQRFFAQVGTTLSATALNYSATLNALCQLAVPTLADWCTVHIREDDGTISRLEIAYGDPTQKELAAEFERYPIDLRADRPLARVLQTGEPLLLPSIDEETLAAGVSDERQLETLRRLDLRSVMIVPLTARHRTLGTITLIATGRGRPYDERDLARAEEFARRAALVVDNARLYRESQEANRVKAEFLATISHELRTPLNAIIGYSDLLTMGIGGDDATRADEYAKRIGISARHLAQLIEEVLAFSRLESGREVVSVERFRLEDLIDEIRVITEPLAAEKGIQLSIDSGAPSVEMTSDDRKIRQVLLNVVGNAIKFTEAGEVSVGWSRDGDEVILLVRDTGVGIPEEAREQIFEPFWQVEQGTTRAVGGTGLGLTVTRRLLHLLGGRLELESEMGKGTTIHLHIPVHYRQSGEESDPAGAPQGDSPNQTLRKT